MVLVLMVVTVGSDLKQALFPAPPAPANLGFGKFEFAGFPQSPVSRQPSAYSLNTASGQLPTFAEKISVYKLLQPQPNLLGLDKIKTYVKTIGFADEPTPLSDSQFQWTNTQTSEKLTYNIVTNDFEYSKDYLNDQNVLAATNLSDEASAIQTAKNFFTNYSSFPSDIDETKTQTSLYKISDGKLIPATSLSDANLIRVDFFQSDFNQTPIYYENYPKSIMYAYIGSSDKTSEVVQAQYTHKTILKDFEATYPLISAQDAFDKLKNGQGYIASYDGTSSNVIIRNVGLGYYIGTKSQPYTIPVVVFSGDNNFFGFVVAVKD